MSDKPSFLARLGRLRAQWVQGLRDVRRIGYFPWQPLVIFDVGANDGTTFSHMPRWFPWMRFYAFEPTPDLVAKLCPHMARWSNYHLIPKAVAETRGTLRFNVAGVGDWGCSSLLEFADGLDRTWPGRDDFKVTRQIEVETIRLGDFVREHRIERIDFLHVDTQGTDLNVLRSLGEEIRRVRAGVIEVPQSREVMLYRNQHTREEAMEFFAKNGFKVWKTVSQQNEDNLYFRRM